MEKAQITVTITGTTWPQITEGWDHIVESQKAMQRAEELTAPEAPGQEDKPAPKKRSLAPKEKKVEEKAEPIAEDDDLDLGEDEVTEAPTISMEDDLIPAFRTYVQNNSKDAARKVLAKFGAQSVKELEPKHWKKALAMIS